MHSDKGSLEIKRLSSRKCLPTFSPISSQHLRLRGEHKMFYLEGKKAGLCSALLLSSLAVYVSGEIDYEPCSWETVLCYGAEVGGNGDECVTNRTCNVLATLYPYDVSSKLEINLQAKARSGH